MTDDLRADVSGLLADAAGAVQRHTLYLQALDAILADLDLLPAHAAVIRQVRNMLPNEVAGLTKVSDALVGIGAAILTREGER